MVNNNKQGFVKESYKGNKKTKPIKKIVQTILLGGLAGFIAAIVFAFTAPAFAKLFHEDKEEQVVMPGDDVSKKVDDATSKAPDNDDAKDKKVNGEQKDKEPVVVEKTISLGIDDYRHLYTDLSHLSNELKRSVLDIIVEKSDDEGLIKPVQKHKNIGLVVAESKKSFFILTNYIKAAKSNIKVVIGDTVNPVSYVSHNDATGLMVVKLSKSDLSEDQYKSIEVAECALSNADALGKPVIVYGNLCDGRLGYAYGSICSNVNTHRFIDADYSMLMTTVDLDTDSSAVIADLTGKIVGFVDKNSKTNLKEAFSISEIKTMVEKLSNGDKVAVLGVKAEDITGKNISKDIENGVFVLETQEDTPAMLSGILPGDIITGIDNIKINSMLQLQNMLRAYKPKQNIKIQLLRQKLDKYDKIEIDLELK